MAIEIEMNTLNHVLQSRSTPVAEDSQAVNTTHHTFTKKDRKHFERMRSGALQRRDQDVRGHRRLGGKIAMSRSNPELADGRTKTVPFNGKPNEFGTIGAQLSQPTR